MCKSSFKARKWFYKHLKLLSFFPCPLWTSFCRLGAFCPNMYIITPYIVRVVIIIFCWEIYTKNKCLIIFYRNARLHFPTFHTQLELVIFTYSWRFLIGQNCWIKKAVISQPAFTFSKLTLETLEQGVK